MYTVAVYLHDRAYGGPEEGGWHYDCAEPVLNETWALRLIRHFIDKEAAHAYEDSIYEMVIAHNRERPDISSVASEGRYDVRTVEHVQFPYFPTTRPHYE